MFKNNETSCSPNDNTVQDATRESIHALHPISQTFSHWCLWQNFTVCLLVLSRPFKVNFQPLPSSMPLSSMWSILQSLCQQKKTTMDTHAEFFTHLRWPDISLSTHPPTSTHPLPPTPSPPTPIHTVSFFPSLWWKPFCCLFCCFLLCWKHMKQMKYC